MKITLSSACGILFALVVIVILLQFTYKEPFAGRNISYNHHSQWANDAKQYGSSFVDKKHSNYKGTSVPLPEGEMFYFANNRFAGECCPSTYSSSTGCACLSNEQKMYLNQRAGNRTFSSEY